MRLTKPILILLFIIGLVMSEDVLNDHINEVLNQSTITNSNNVDSCTDVVTSTMNQFIIEWSCEKETESLYNQFGILSKMVLNEINKDTNFLLTENPKGWYSEYTFPYRIINGRKVRVQVNIKNALLNGSLLPDETQWEDAKKHFYLYGVQGIAFKKAWDVNNATIVRMTYMRNISINYDAWTSPKLYNASAVPNVPGDIVIHRGKIYECMYDHTSQINIMPGALNIWYWRYISDVTPDIFEITQFNIIEP